MKTIKIYVDQINRHIVRTYDDNEHIISEKWEENSLKEKYQGWLPIKWMEGRTPFKQCPICAAEADEKGKNPMFKSYIQTLIAEKVAMKLSNA